MRILLWHGYLLGGTGSNVYTRALAREWSRAGHDVVVFSQEPRPYQYDLGGAATVRPDIGGLLPTFVLDRYEGLEARRLPDLTPAERGRYVELNAAALLLAVVNAVAQDPQMALTAVASALLRGGVLALCFLALRIGYRRLRQREGIGLGDVKLAAVAGAWLDWLILPTAVEIAAISALALYAVHRYVLGRPFDPQSRMPFGLFLAPAIWLGWLLQTAVGAPP